MINVMEGFWYWNCVARYSQQMLREITVVHRLNNTLTLFALCNITVSPVRGRSCVTAFCIYLMFQTALDTVRGCLTCSICCDLVQLLSLSMLDRRFGMKTENKKSKTMSVWELNFSSNSVGSRRNYLQLSYVGYRRQRISFHKCDNKALKTNFYHLDMITSLSVKRIDNAENWKCFGRRYLHVAQVGERACE